MQTKLTAASLIGVPLTINFFWPFKSTEKDKKESTETPKVA